MDSEAEFSSSLPSSTTSTPTPSSTYDIFTRKKRQTWEEALGPATISEGIDRADLSSLPSVQSNGRRYLREDHLGKKFSKPRKSFIFDHGIGIVEVNNKFEITGHALWLCRLCDQVGRIYTCQSRSTSSAKDHLLQKHKLIEGQASQSSKESSSSRSVDVLDLQV